MTQISFVTTIFNKSKFIPHVVDSIFSQKNIGKCEYIFIDDGSTDDSVEIIERCTAGTPNVKIISQKNAGPAIATNRGIAEASSPYIKLMDGDDILQPTAVSELLEAMLSFKVGMAYSRIEPIPFVNDCFEIPDIPESNAPIQLQKNALGIFYKQAFFNPTCVLASTEIVKEAGGCDPRVFIQDYSFALRMAAKTDFVYVPKILAWAPMEVVDRVSDMGGGSQTLHDLNAALGYFVADNPNLDPKIKSRMLKRATGRSWKWAKRMQHASVFSKHYARYLGAKISPLSGITSERILETCDAFRGQSGSGIRIP
ncbi:MAG: glycosyltransferase family 2 protein [Pseudomonadota bacterium]